MGDDPEKVQVVSREAGLYFVHGTAYYLRSGRPDYLDDMTEVGIEDELASDVTEAI